jgi:hypothetical protein
MEECRGWLACVRLHWRLGKVQPSMPIFLGLGAAEMMQRLELRSLCDKICKMRLTLALFSHQLRTTADCLFDCSAYTPESALEGCFRGSNSCETSTYLTRSISEIYVFFCHHFLADQICTLDTKEFHITPQLAILGSQHH